MHRLVLLCCVALAILVPRAQALEMFTSFHNGENIGFPPMEVPIAIYGHGGWNCKAVKCRPERVESIESVPAMTPTGCARNDHVPQGHAIQCASNQTNTREQVQYLSDRRRSWGNSNDASTAGYNQQSDYNASDSSAQQSPTPAKVAPKSDGWTRSLEQAPADNDHGKKPTSVFAHPGTAPQTESAGKIKTNTGQAVDQRAQPPSGGSSRQPNDNLHSVVPPQPID